MKKEVINKNRFNNRLLYTFILLGLIFLLSVGIYAFNSATDAYHTSSYISFSDGSILSNYIADNAITSAKIADGTIASGDIADNAITSAKIADGTIASGDIANNAITSTKIADGTITASDISTSTSPTFAGLTINGDLSVTGTITGNSFIYSDKTLKKNILPLTNSLNKIQQLQGVSFDWKKDGRADIGLIAQDVEKVYPELVHTSAENGLKSVEYGNIVAVLIEAVKEQQQEIDYLQKEIEELKRA